MFAKPAIIMRMKPIAVIKANLPLTEQLLITPPFAKDMQLQFTGFARWQALKAG